MGFGVQSETDGGTPGVSLDCTPGHRNKFTLIAPLQQNVSSCSPFLPQSRLDQYPSPASLDLKEESVGIGDQVVRACLDEKPVSQLRFEEDSVEENVLPSLAEAGTKSEL